MDRKLTLILMTAGDPDACRPSLRTDGDAEVRVNQRSVICRPLTSLVAMSIDPIFTSNLYRIFTTTTMLIIYILCNSNNNKVQL